MNMYGNAVTFEGNLTKDPTLRPGKFGPSVSFSVAHNHKAQSGAESVTFVNCVANGPLAVNISKSFRKGDGILLVGALTNYQSKEGGNLTGLKVEFAGPSLTFATAEIEKNARGSYDKDAFVTDSEDDEDADDEDVAPAPRKTRAAKPVEDATEDEDEDEAPVIRRRKTADKPATARRTRVTKPAEEEEDEFAF
jgi:single-stranded DNA-binding protein